MAGARWVLLPVFLFALAGWVSAQDPGKHPSAAEVKDLLQKEPFTQANWPVWRGRLLSWFGDRSRQTDAAFQAALAFVQEQADSRHQLPEYLAKDHIAWYFLGHSFFYRKLDPDFAQAEIALRRSLQLEPNFARAHRSLGMALMSQDKNAGGPRLLEAEKELDRARQLDPQLPLHAIHGELALRQNRPQQAEALFRQALQEDPKDSGVATALANAILSQRDRPGSRAAAIRDVQQQFPDDGMLVCFHGVALALDNDPRGCLREFDRARAMGVEPSQVIHPQLMRQIEEAAAPSLIERFGWTLLYFAGFYLAVMAGMALTGLLLARRTRGKGALSLLKADPDNLLESGQIARVQGETMLARLYAFALFLGLILFYASIPFIILGLLGGTGVLLYLIFMMGRIPVKLVAIIVIVGLGMTWAVFKSLFSRPASGAFGLPKSADELPRLHQVVRDVAQRIDTEPVDEIYLAPGSAIGVHQEGRGPFGMFGVKSRVLTLGVSTMRYLTVGELQAILAHEYGHFSHKDTFYSRFIYQVHLSIEQALNGMGAAGGVLNYANPFYWFLFLYYKCYSLLSAGFYRSREFLADRMACCLYGSDVFATALSKVCTDGTLFEMTMYENINQLLEKQQSFINMYDAFKSFRDEQMSRTEREELYQKLLNEEGSLFASHPTFGERMEAVASLPRAAQIDGRSARELFEDPEAVEKELTQFLTEYMYAVQQIQAQAAAEAQA
jgi:Zn-dependent protease with chaperone function/Flp pilus assembly protein TadD